MMMTNCKDNQSRGLLAAKAMLLHVLPIGLTTLCMFMLWVLITLPMVAVFALDADLVLSKYTRFLVHAFSIAFGNSIFILFPLSLFGELLEKKSKNTIWVFPMFLLLCASIIVIVRLVVLESFRAAMLGWSGFVLLISVLFALYWATFWTEKKVLAYWKKFKQHK